MDTQGSLTSRRPRIELAAMRGEAGAHAARAFDVAPVEEADENRVEVFAAREVSARDEAQPCLCWRRRGSAPCELLIPQTCVCGIHAFLIPSTFIASG